LKIHPNDARLEEFVLSLGSDHQGLLRHVAGCVRCRARLYYLPRQEPRTAKSTPPTAEHEYGEALERSQRFILDRALALERERQEAPSLLAEILRHPPEQREAPLCHDRRFRTWGLFELLVERSWEVCVPDPAYAEELGRLALRLSDCLETSLYGAELVHDLRARAWAYIGNARRLRADLLYAEKAFVQAHEHLLKGTGDPSERALFSHLKASLLRAQRRFDGALDLLHKAVTIFLKSGEPHQAGKSMITMSIVYNHRGYPDRALQVLSEALELIDSEQDPRLMLHARHNLAVYMADLGRFEEAQSEYQKNRPLYRDFPDGWTQNRRKWLKAKITRGLGRSTQAEALFLEARAGFIAEEAVYDAALVSLELATLYGEQSRLSEVKNLSQEMVPIFASREVHREALAAVLFFLQAVEAERANRELFSRVTRFLKEAAYNPALQFHIPA
jgi:tetratricopeptide (TPR) repeat protein